MAKSETEGKSGERESKGWLVTYDRFEYARSLEDRPRGDMCPVVFRDGKRIDAEVRRSYRKLVELTEDPVALREIAIQAFHDWRLSRKEAERIAALAIPKAPSEMSPWSSPRIR